MGRRSSPIIYFIRVYIGSRFAFHWQVLVMLVTAMFSCPGLDWSSPGDSVELFAGDCSITKGEWKDHKLGAHWNHQPKQHKPTKG